MTEASSTKTLDELTETSALSIEDLANRDLLIELLSGVSVIFGLPMRLFGGAGGLLAEAGASTPALYGYLGNSGKGKQALIRVVEAVKAIEPNSGVVFSNPSPIGLRYAVSSVKYDQRRIGRIVVGPFRAADALDVPASLQAMVSELEPTKIGALWREIPQANDQTVERVVAHLSSVLDLVLFSGHRALLASNMHLASVRESFRELREKTASLEIAYERLKELDRLKSNFLATVSHELRTPLTSIIGYSEMLTAGIAGELTQEQHDFIQTIQEKGAQLLELIKGLLDLTKLESGTLILRKSEAQIPPLLDDIVQTFLPHARRKSVELIADYEPALPEVWGEPARLRQVLSNLTENAIKFTPASGQVRLSARSVLMDVPMRDDGPAVVMRALRRTAVEIRVADTGIGIPAGERQKVFDAFYQVDSSSTREQGGTGLGLSIVKRLVDAHEGSVRIEGN
ncbi:MAG TPA: ATP-binding protein, partial [Polyangiaceae bacterium]|nr:ATP-binding protein [Polyangiaceae bacterium]